MWKRLNRRRRIMRRPKPPLITRRVRAPRRPRLRTMRRSNLRSKMRVAMRKMRTMTSK
uniref:Uncharacterized protein n=1 Tax=Aegilops tauschii subsp. strangulata TaxID=200361 RepID=A0A453P939_AEGTS